MVFGLVVAFFAHDFGRLKGEIAGRKYGKAFAYRICTPTPSLFCTPSGLGLPENVRELSHDALSTLP
jgi:hypothetical protein